MAEPFLAEIRLMPYSFAPLNWAFCAGQVMPISQNTALFSLLGTNYGGNGTTVFGLPNLIGRVAVGAGQGPGLTNRDLGETEGQQTVPIDGQTLPAHTHSLQAIDNALAKANVSVPANNTVFARAAISNQDAFNPYQTTPNPGLVAMSPQIVGTSTGGGQAHNNMQPYIVVNACIALRGLFPQRP